MKILVPVKRVIDANVRVRVNPTGTALAADAVQMSLNPFDETAVEAAVRLKETGRAQEIVVVSIGPTGATETLRTTLAMGADRALLIETATMPEPPAIARLLATVCAEENPDLVLCGRQAIDDDAGQTGPMLAALLGWAQAVGVSHLTLEDGTATARCEADQGTYTLRFALPAVATADLRWNTPRYVTLPNLIKAKRKPLTIRPLTDFAVAATPKTERLAFREPSPRQPGPLAADVVEFATRLWQAGGGS